MLVMRRPVLALSMSLACLSGCRREDTSVAGLAPAAAPIDAARPAMSADRAATAPRAPPRDEPEIPMPGPRRGRLAAAVAENAACEACHEDEAKAWRGSYHQRANIDPAYERAFAVEPLPFCRGCHAPEANPMKRPSEAVSALGVGCVTCHVTEEGFVLAALHDTEAAPRPPAPHPLRRSRAFAREGACAGCHEFRFPFPGGDDDAFFMQTTAREHRRSPGAEMACADCHMPSRQGRRSHAFSEVRDEAWLSASLDVTVTRTTEDTLAVELVQTNPGHDFPTGDLFRRLEVGYAIEGPSGEVVRREARHLARHFELVPGQIGRQLVRDDRVQGEPTVVSLELPPPGEAPPDARIAWWVTYQRVATVGKGHEPAGAIIDSEVVLRSGSLSWSAPPHSPPSPERP